MARPARRTKLFQLLDFLVGGAVLINRRLDWMRPGAPTAAAGARRRALDAGRNMVMREGQTRLEIQKKMHETGERNWQGGEAVAGERDFLSGGFAEELRLNSRGSRYGWNDKDGYFCLRQQG